MNVASCCRARCALRGCAARLYGPRCRDRPEDASPRAHAAPRRAAFARMVGVGMVYYWCC